jgi:hypothetical protein
LKAAASNMRYSVRHTHTYTHNHPRAWKEYYVHVEVGRNLRERRETVRDGRHGSVVVDVQKISDRRQRVETVVDCGQSLAVIDVEL